MELRRSYVTGSSQSCGLQSLAAPRAVRHRGSTCMQICAWGTLLLHPAETGSWGKPGFSGTLPICCCLPMEWIVQAMTNSSHFSKALSALGEVGHRWSPAPFPQAVAALLQHREIWRANHSCRHPTTVSVWCSCMHANQLLQFFQECLVYRQSNLTHYIVCLLTLCCYNWNKDIQIKILRKMRSQKIMWKIFN